jgi:hypothetical protein
MTPAATPISATAKQQQQNNNDKNQVHSKSPVRYRLQMEATGRGELSSAARLEFHYWLSSLTAAFAEGRIAERPTLIAKAGTDAMRDHRTTGRSRWPPGTERRRSRRSANDGSAGGHAQLVPTMGALLVGPLDINTEQGQDPLQDGGETDQDHEKLEQLRQPAIGGKLVDRPEADGADDDNNQNTNQS